MAEEQLERVDLVLLPAWNENEQGLQNEAYVCVGACGNYCLGDERAAKRETARRG